jgi:hypothetical protein
MNEPVQRRDTDDIQRQLDTIILLLQAILKLLEAKP